MGRRRKNRLDLPLRVYCQSGTYWFRPKEGKPVNLGRDYHQAMIRYAEVNQRPDLMRTLGHVMDRYQADIIPTKSPRTQIDYIGSLKLLRAVFGHMAPEEIEPHHIYGYMDARNAPVRANRDVAVLSQVFQLAIRWGYPTDNPCKKVNRNTEKPRTRYVEDWEFWAVYDLASPALQVAMLLAVMTGARQQTILRLTVHQLRDDGIYIEHGKGGRRVLVAWTDELEEAVDRAKTLKRKRQTEYLLGNRQGEPYTRDGFGTIWQRLMRKAIAGKVIQERYTWHDLRAKTGSDGDGRLLGHQDPRTLNRVYKRKPETVTPLSVKRPK